MKELEIKEQEKDNAVRLRLIEDGEVISVRYINEEVYNLLIQKVKKEVFDDIEKSNMGDGDFLTTKVITEDSHIGIDANEYLKLKKKHLGD